MRLPADQRKTEEATARALAHHEQTAAAVEAGVGPAVVHLRAVERGHRERVAAIEAYRAGVQDLLVSYGRAHQM